jgi:disulfide oxidoreductase YuzD
VDKKIKLDTSCDVHNITKESIVYHQYKNIRSLYIYIYISDARLELDSRKRITNVIQNDHMIPLFFVEINPNKNDKKIFNESLMLHTKNLI